MRSFWFPIDLIILSLSEYRLHFLELGFRVDPATIEKLKFLAVELDRSLTDLFLEAIYDLLEKYIERVKR